MDFILFLLKPSGSQGFLILTPQYSECFCIEKIKNNWSIFIRIIEMGYYTLRKKYLYLDFFWSVFFRIRTEYGETRPEFGKIQTRKTSNTDT